MKVNKLFEVRLNTHQTHLESLIMLGKAGIAELNSYIDKFISMLEGGQKELTLMSKIDGSPSVFMWHKIGNGYPDNSIALKSFVNGPNTSISSEEEINIKYGDRPDMAEKLKECLKLSKYIPEGEAWQGDCLFTKNDLKEETINGEKYVTFHPNKIVYAFSEDNPGYNSIKNADLGIAFHTIYKINNGKISQSFDVDNSKIKAPNNFYLLFHEMDIKGKESDFNIDKIKNDYNELKVLENNLLSDDNYENLINNKSFINYWNTFENQEFADKKLVEINSNTVLKDLKDYILDKKDKEFNKKQATLKTDSGKLSAKEKYDKDLLDLENLLKSNKVVIENIVKTINKASELKMELWRSLNMSKDNFSTFYKSKTQGYIPANREGISMSDKDGNLVKIVDRAEFSSNNRNPDFESGWEHNESFGVATQGVDIGAFNKFNKLIEEDVEKVAVVGVGRMNPPTIGHQALVNAMADIGHKYGVKPKLFLTHTTNNAKNPLSYDSKVRWAEKAFGDKVEIVKTDARTVLEFLSELYNEGFTKIVYAGDKERIGGSEDVTATILKYNNTPDKSGKLLYNFDEIKFEDTGSREVPYEGAERASATYVRKLVTRNDFEEFKKYVPFNESDSKKLFRELRQILKGVDESLVEACNKRIEQLKENTQLNEKPLGSSDIYKHNGKYFNAIINKIINDKKIKIGDKGEQEIDLSKFLTPDKIKELSELDSNDSLLMSKFNDILDGSGVRWTNIFKGQASGYDGDKSGGPGVGAEIALKNDSGRIQEFIDLITPYMVKKYGKVDNIIVKENIHAGAENNKRGVSFEDLFTVQDLYKDVMEGPSTSRYIADNIYILDITLKNGKHVEEPIYISVKDGPTVSPINLGITRLPASDIINTLTTGLSSDEYKLMEMVINLKGTNYENVLAIDKKTGEQTASWYYDVPDSKVNTQNLKNAIINSYGNNYYYYHLINGKVAEFKEVSEITDELRKNQVSNVRLSILSSRIVIQFDLGDLHCGLYLRRKGSPSMALLAEVKRWKGAIQFKATQLTNIKKYNFEYNKR